MKEAGYSPNPIARGLSRGSMRMVGVLCTNIHDPFYAAAVGYIEEHLREQDLTAVLRCTGDDGDFSCETTNARGSFGNTLLGNFLPFSHINTHFKSSRLLTILYQYNYKHSRINCQSPMPNFEIFLLT